MHYTTTKGLSLLLLALVLALGSAQAVGQSRGSMAEAGRLHQQGLQHFQNGRYAEAELLFRRVLAIVEKALGPNHPDTG